MATTPASLVSEINSIYAPLLSGLTFDLNIPLEFYFPTEQAANDEDDEEFLLLLVA